MNKWLCNCLAIEVSAAVHLQTIVFVHSKPFLLFFHELAKVLNSPPHLRRLLVNNIYVI